MVDFKFLNTGKSLLDKITPQLKTNAFQVPKQVKPQVKTVKPATLSMPKPVQTTEQIKRQETFDTREKLKQTLTSPFLNAFQKLTSKQIVESTPFVSGKIVKSKAPTKLAVEEVKQARGLGVGLVFGKEETALEREISIINKAKQKALQEGVKLTGAESPAKLAKYLSPSERLQLEEAQFTVAGTLDVSGGLSSAGKALSRTDDLLGRATKLFGEKRTVDLVPPGRGGQPMQRVGREGIEVPATPPKNPLIEEAKKYKTTVNLQDKNDLRYLKQIFSDDVIEKLKSGEKVNWRGDSYEDIAGINIISKPTKTVAQQLEGRIEPTTLSTQTFYHGTDASNADNILRTGFKPGAKLPEDTFRGGGYGRMQNSISLAESPKEASVFSSLSKDGRVLETKLKDTAKVVSIKGVDDAIDLEDFIPYLKSQKIDAVYIGGGEKELVVINPKAISSTKIWEEANQPKQITQPTPKTKSMGTVGGEKNVAFLKGGDEFNLPPKVELTESEQKIAEVLRKNKLNTAEASKKFKEVYKKKIDDYVAILKEDGFKGVQQGSLNVNADGEVVGRTGRMSNNPKWYRDYYAEFNRQPSETALRSIAIKHLSEGHVDDLYEVPVDRDFLKAKSLIDNIDNLRVKLKGLDPELRKEAKAYYNVFEEKDDFVDVSVVAPELEAKLNGIKEKLTSLKDIGLIKTNNRDLIRNARQVLGKDLADELIVRPLDKANLENVEFIDYLAESLDANVVKKFRFKKGSKESADIMKYGEGRMTEAELAKKYSPEKIADIKEADAYFRNMYNNLVEVGNQQIAKIYPNNPEKLIPIRKDYYRHFQEDGGLVGLINDLLFNEKISGSLSGISNFTKPKSKWSSIKQKRTSDKTVDDAIGGFINYIPQISQIITLDPVIAKFRATAQFLGQITNETKNINNFLNVFNKNINTIAGKSNFLDSPIQDIIGRDTVRFLNALGNRVKANQIVGNATSVVAAPANIVNAMGQTSVKSSVAAYPLMLRDLVVGNNKSKWLKVRYAESFNKFDVGILENTAKFAAWFLKKGDQISAYYAWNAKYLDELNKGVRPKKAIQSADEFARQISAGRAIGEKPILQESKVLQLIAPFQLEVGNAIWNLEDAFKNAPTKLKGAGVILSIFIAAHLYNKAAKEVRGAPVVMDPIQALIDAVQIARYEEGFRKVWKPAGRLAGEFFSNIPFGQTIASYYPEFGGDVLPPRKELFGAANPTRFGTDPLFTKAIIEPLYYGVLPFGGAQVKKTIEGIQGLVNGEVRNKQGDLMFKLPATVRNILQAPTMGKYSTPEARQFFDEQEAPSLIPARNLLKKQKEKAESIDKAVKDLKATGKVSEELLNKDGIEKLVDSFKESPDLTKEQKLIKQMNAETQVEYFNYKAETMEQKEFLKFLLKNIQDKSVKKEAAAGLIPIINKINVETN